MSTDPTSDPTLIPQTVAVDGNEYEGVVRMVITEGVLDLHDSEGWLRSFAPGAWGQVCRVDPVELPDIPGGNPRNLG